MEQQCTHELHGDFSTHLPRGLKALIDTCRAFYPDQKFLLDAAQLGNYWKGGNKLLEHIYIFHHPGEPSRDIPAHWYYVTFGLSDLYGDGRIFSSFPNPDGLSGFGLEMTFRLKQSSGETIPPDWPAVLLHKLADYVYCTNIALWAGDNITWQCPLDNSNSRIAHMIMCNDPQMGPVPTPNGRVYFMQLVGVTFEELQAAQMWNGRGVARLLQKVFGPWLVTDMRRKNTLFDVDPTAQAHIDQGVERDGSCLETLSTNCSWHMLEEDEASMLERKFQQISIRDVKQIEARLQRELEKWPFAGRQQHGMDNNDNADEMLGSVHLCFNLVAGTLLPLVLRGRLRHGRPFAFQNKVSNASITLVPKGIAEAVVDEGRPLVCHGPLLWVCLLEEDIQEALKDLDEWAKTGIVIVPRTFEWCKGRLLVTLVHDDFSPRKHESGL